MRNPLIINNLSHLSHRFRLSPTRARAHTCEAVIRHRWDRWDSRDSDAQTHLVAFGRVLPHGALLRGRGTAIQIALQKFWEMDLDDKYRS